jgi:predicted N-formylglutamate amidohydrolase
MRRPQALSKLAVHRRSRRRRQRAYGGKHPSDFTVDQHAGRAGLPHVCIEVRRDQFRSAAARALGADLAPILRAMIEDPALRRLQPESSWPLANRR